MNIPSITPAQIVAFLQPILACLIAFGVDLSDTQQVAILGLSGTFSTFLLIADAIIRNGRAKAIGNGANVSSDGKKLGV